MDWADVARAAQQKQNGDEDMVDDDDDDDDFYGHAKGADPPAPQTLAAASPGSAPFAGITNRQLTTPQPANGNLQAPTPASITEQRKLENQKKAEELRAKLIANRQSTTRTNTPVRTNPKPPTPQPTAAQQSLENTSAVNVTAAEKKDEPSSDIFGVDQLLREGQAAADAKARTEDTAASAKEGNEDKTDLPAATPDAPPAAESQASVSEAQRGPPAEIANNAQPVKDNRAQHNETEYYADLAVWLEMTGYHDINYRNSKLRTYKERKALEEEAARIQEKLEKLRQTEQAEMRALRAGSVHPVATPNRPPPVLAFAAQAVAGATPATNKTPANRVKRAHSPEPVLEEKNARHRDDANGIRIRGANDSPRERPRPSTRGRGDSPPGRRVNYPDARRPDHFGESNGRVSRDPSLERRQSYYGQRDVDDARGRDRYDRAYPLTRENGRGRMGFSAVNVPQERPHREAYPPAPRGIRDVDTGRGDVEYFMIKSWNADNVNAAMRDSLWSTQLKNEDLLSEAYYSKKSVVLCFSVNNSKQFQGYALMASPPDPALPKPAFCAKLNWPTSPAFRLQWLATVPVHFRYVGHIKNPLNMDDAGHPSAVLVGKDGQEIEHEAGRALCEILDDASAAESGRAGGRW